jgi:hypothetical protein
MKPLERILLVVSWLFFSTSALAQKAEMPLPGAFNVGDSWQWQQVDNRTKAVEGTRTRTVVDDGGIAKFSFSDLGIRQISSAFLGNPSKKPWRVWPLQVGEKWSYDEDWTRPDGATGNSSQDAEVIAYEEVTVPAGKFMAFRIEYKGVYTNYRARSGGQQKDTFWYAPDVLADVKHIRDDGFNMYTRELVSYTRGPSGKI